MGNRPAALLVYCGLLAVLIIVSAGYSAYSLLAPSAVAPTIADVVIAFLPLAILAAAVTGMWFMRWWAIALFWLWVLGMIVITLFIPFSGPSDPFLFALAMNVAIWAVIVALPPTFIAAAYRRRFR